jgi:ribonuclease D
MDYSIFQQMKDQGMSRIFLAKTYEEAQAYSAQILDLAPIVVGFDTETTVSSTRESKLLSLISIATPCDGIYLFQISRIYLQKHTFPSRLRDILFSDRIVKVGCGLSGDVRGLIRSYNLLLEGLHGFVDIQYLTLTLKVPESSLRDLCARYLPDFPGKDPFGHSGSDWDNDLDERQINYASSDAELSLRLYLKILSIPDTEHISGSRDGQNKDEELVHKWITIQLKSAVSDRTVKSLVNQIVNSYGPWRNKFIESERKEKAAKCLQTFIDQGKWSYDKLKDSFNKT